MLVALKPLHDYARIKRIVVSTYQAVSGKSAQAREELLKQTKDVAAGREPEVDPNIFPYPIYNNCLPHIDVFLPDGYTKEELKMILETRKILEDETIRFNSKWGRKYCPDLQFRRIVIDIEGEEPLVLLTNHLNFGATTLASIYKDRWQIEVFFKALKQNLKIKSFVGTSPNAIYIQIWTALIAMLLLKWLHYLSKAKWSMSNLAAMLRLNLFTYRELQAWLDHPFSTPPLVPLTTQLDLQLDGFGQIPFGYPADLLPQEPASRT
jgi:IS4 transposase